MSEIVSRDVDPGFVLRFYTVRKGSKERRHRGPRCRHRRHIWADPVKTWYLLREELVAMSRSKNEELVELEAF